MSADSEYRALEAERDHWNLLAQQWRGERDEALSVRAMLRRENGRLRAEREAALLKVRELEEAQSAAMEEWCDDVERHEACVEALRAEREEAQSRVEALERAFAGASAMVSALEAERDDARARACKCGSGERKLMTGGGKWWWEQ